MGYDARDHGIESHWRHCIFLVQISTDFFNSFRDKKANINILLKKISSNLNTFFCDMLILMGNLWVNKENGLPYDHGHNNQLYIYSTTVLNVEDLVMQILHLCYWYFQFEANTRNFASKDSSALFPSWVFGFRFSFWKHESHCGPPAERRNPFCHVLCSLVCPISCSQRRIWKGC